MYLRLLNGEENHAKEVAGRLKEKENMIYEKINTHSRKKDTEAHFSNVPLLFWALNQTFKWNQNLNN